MKIVRGIDVGYGRTKYVTLVGNGQIGCDLFPSIAPILTGSLLSDPILKTMDVVQVDMGGVIRVVGKDAQHFQGALMSKIMDDSYSGSDTYIALTRGALFYMGEKNINLLVVGLPVTIFKNAEIRDRLRKNLIGLHKINNGFVVNVENVQVLPQPLGGLYDAMANIPEYSNAKNQTSLIVDAGYHTFMFMVANGIKFDHQRNGAYHKSMGAILASIAEGISADPKVASSYTDLQRIDDALLGKKEFKVSGQFYDLSRHISVAEPASNSRRNYNDPRSIC